MISSFLTTLLVLTSLLKVVSSLRFDIRRNPVVYDAQLRRQAKFNNFSKRANAVTAPLLNSLSQGLYYINVTVGTPGQKLALQIDTGSSDTWVPSSSATLCHKEKEGGCPDGTFSASQSTTFNLVGQNQFNISYVDDSGASGDYFQDNFSIGDTTLSNLEMGLALDTSIGTGIMGIGYNTSEANSNLKNGGNGTIYPNIPFVLVNQGQTKSPAYSLWLNDLESSTGSILFGSVDTAKYSGDLISIDVYPTSRNYGITSFTVAFTSLSATSSTGTDQLTSSEYAVPAILDSGTTITLLPDDIAALIFQELGAIPDDRIGAVLVPCTLAQNNGTLNYGFGGTNGPVIKVAISDLVLPLTDSRGKSPSFKNGQKACQLGIEPAGSLPVLFGDTFLRSAYVVYDLINNRVALAQTNFNSTKSNIVPFPSFGAAIPNAKIVSNQIQVTQTVSNLPKVGTTAKASGTSYMDILPTPSPTDLSARAGFTTMSPMNSNSNKLSFADAGPKPFSWAWTVIASISLALMGVGSLSKLF